MPCSLRFQEESSNRIESLTSEPSTCLTTHNSCLCKIANKSSQENGISSKVKVKSEVEQKCGTDTANLQQTQLSAPVQGEQNCLWLRPDMSTRTLQVPIAKHSAIIGPGGSTIQYVLQATQPYQQGTYKQHALLLCWCRKKKRT